MKAKFHHDAIAGTVTLEADDPLFDGRISRTFYTRGSSGYVYEWSGPDYGSHKQVCNGLRHYGNTLTAGNNLPLIDLIRREWRIARRGLR